MNPNEKALAVAIELLRRQVADLGMAVIQNSLGNYPDVRAGGQPAPPVAQPAAAVSEAQRPIVDKLEEIRRLIADLPRAHSVMQQKGFEQMSHDNHAQSASAYDTRGFGREEGFGGNRLQHGHGEIEGPRQGFGGKVGEVLGKGLGKAASSGAALAMSFGRLLGPLALITTFIGASTSGFSIFNQAMQLFAATVAPIFMPVFFLLATGLVALSDVFMKKLMPAINDFTKVAIQQGIPAITSFINMISRAADALGEIANTKVGRALVGTSTAPGMLGSLDRLTGGGDIESDKSTTGRVKRAGRGLFDTMNLIPGGNQTIKAADFLSRHTIGVESKDFYTGAGVKKTGAADESKRATAQASQDVLRQMMMSSGSKASVGDIRGSFKAAQMSVLSMTPFEQKMLAIAQQQLAALQKGIPIDEKAIDEFNTLGSGGRRPSRREGE